VGYAGHEERRERILRAAAGLLEESGIAALTVRAVAETAAGIGMGTLRHYFPTQQALHRALILKLVDDEVHDFDIRDHSVPAATRLERCLLQFVPMPPESEHLLDIWFGMYRVGLDPEGRRSRGSSSKSPPPVPGTASAVGSTCSRPKDGSIPQPCASMSWI